MATLKIPDQIPRPTTRGFLEQLGHWYGAGKSNHKHYYPLYESFLASRRDNVKVVLELGVERGRSLLVWMDYFPHARVLGVDSLLNKDISSGWPDRADGWRVGLYQFDQADRDLLEAMARGCGGFDLIVDDASHDPLKQKKSLQILWPHLHPGGIYVVEDLETSFWELAQWNQDKLSGCVLEGWQNHEGILPFLKSQGDFMTAHYANQRPERFTGLEQLLGIHFYPNICFLEKQWS